MMAGLLASIGVSRTQLILCALGLTAMMSAFGAGYVWGTARATREAIEIANKSAEARVSALDRSYRAVIADYAGKLKTANAMADQLNQKLRNEKQQAADAARAAREKLVHVAEPTLDHAVPAAVLELLREQPARH